VSALPARAAVCRLRDSCDIARRRLNPLVERDVSFYIFSYPFLTYVYQFLFLTLFISLLAHYAPLGSRYRPFRECSLPAGSWPQRRALRPEGW